jgi:GT2 family glycosyltransferase
VKKASLLERFGTAVDYHYIKLLRGTKHPVAPGWCILTCREIFEQSKGFNEKIQFGEDYDYVSRVGHYGFGFVDQTSYFIDLRRVHEEGFKYVYKGIANEVYRHTHKYNLEANRYGYNFGKHGDKAK